MLTFDDLWELLTSQDETQLIEVKQGSEVGKSCWETISAFANEPGLGGGYLIFGIQCPEDSPSGKYEIVGVETPDRIQRDLVSNCNHPEFFNHPIRPNIQVETKAGKNIIVAYIPEASPIEKPIYRKKQGLPQGARRRIGSADIKCTESDLELLFQERKNQSYDTTSITDATLEDLDPNAINAYRLARAKVKPNALELEFNDQDLLYSLNTITRHPSQPQTYCPTVAGMILFGKAIALRRYFPMHRIDYILSSGNDWVANPDERYQSVTELREPLLLGIPRLTALVMNDLPTSFHLEDHSVQRQDIPLIPFKAIREAIVNAVMHRNYRTASPIQIIRYANRLEIHNPGYSLKPTDEIGQSGSLTRNGKIAAVLHDAGIAETKGTGGRVILNTMLEANLTLPQFDSQREKDHFCLTLNTHQLLGEEDTQWLKRFRDHKISDNEARALVLLHQVGQIDNWSYRTLNKVDTLTASRKLTHLRDIGLLQAQGKGKATYYTLAHPYSLSGEFPGSNQETSTNNQGLSGEFPGSNQETSTNNQGLSGEFPGSNQETSTNNQKDNTPSALQLELDLPQHQSLSRESPGSNQETSTNNQKGNTPSTLQVKLDFQQPGIPKSLQDKIKQLGKRSSKIEIRTVIIELCTVKPQSSSELAILLKREHKYVLDGYLKPLIKEGALCYTNPDSPHDPHQRYQVP